MIQDPSASQLPNSIQNRATETRDEVSLRPEGVGVNPSESDGSNRPEHDEIPRSDDNGSLRPEDDRLRQAMAPIMERSVLEVLEQGSKGLIDSLYPLIGRSVRRSVRESLSALAQSVDSTMRDTLTLKQLRWRLEARRKGVSLSQLVMQKSLLFRVEEAFLIHQKTGLLVAHVGARAEDNRDLISGMFTAIQDFVADSFGPSDRQSVDDSQRETLGRFQVGDQDVWLFHGPSAYVAIVIAGNAAESYRDHFHAVLEEIHERFGHELAAYEGDGEALKPAGLLLEDCLVEKQREETKKKSPRLFILLVGVLLALLLGCLWKNWQTRSLHEDVRAHLAGQPGVVITEESRTWRTSRFEVLADPEVLDAEASVNKAFPGKSVILSVAPFRSMDPDAQGARLERALQGLAPAPEMPVVQTSTESGLALSGTVDHAWMVQAKALIPRLGVGLVDLSGLVDRERAECERRSRELAAIPVSFLANQAKVAPSEATKWQRLGEEMRAILDTAQSAKMPCRFLLYGIPPTGGSGDGPWQLYQERVQTARQALLAQGIPNSTIQVGGWPPPDAEVVEREGAASQAIIVFSSFLLSPHGERE